MLVGDAEAGEVYLLSDPAPAVAPIEDIAAADYRLSDPLRSRLGSSLSVGDLDGDGAPDLAMGDAQKGLNSALYITAPQQGSIVLDHVAHTRFAEYGASGESCGQTAIRDLDGDGSDDLVYACPGTRGRSQVYVQHGPIAPGSYHIRQSGSPILQISASDHQATVLMLTDLDHDGDSELILSGREDVSDVSVGSPWAIFDLDP